MRGKTRRKEARQFEQAEKRLESPDANSNRGVAALDLNLNLYSCIDDTTAFADEE
ncbi:MAG: hypothetical protein NBKEAIPA_03348 [Nitrospirae bacterium]|nr:MAG: hypothetical protein UZ03_NOB001002797 [Nitrospira sp. OLB3]MBV6471416.1 hypothetical protein [Nitrospirota bacterium]